MASYFALGIFLMYHASQIFVIHESHEDDDERMFCFTFPSHHSLATMITPRQFLSPHSGFLSLPSSSKTLG